jgi:cytochrome c oxidase subunit 3
LEQGLIGDLSDPEGRGEQAAKTGLIMFLAVVGSLFALLASAFLMRAANTDWRAAPMPGLLWLNTAVLVFSSAAMQVAVAASRRGETQRARLFLLSGAGAAFAFLAGQFLAWRQFEAAGYFLSSNPANAFFYLLTGLHGAHLTGGMAALALAVSRAQGDVSAAQPAIRLCAIYWHFLLVVWLILFALLLGWGGDVVAICRGLVS